MGHDWELRVPLSRTVRAGDGTVPELKQGGPLELVGVENDTKSGTENLGPLETERLGRGVGSRTENWNY